MIKKKLLSITMALSLAAVGLVSPVKAATASSDYASKQLTDAFIKNQDITSCEMKEDVNIKFTIDNLDLDAMGAPKEDQLMVNTVLKALSDIKINTEMQYAGNKEKSDLNMYENDKISFPVNGSTYNMNLNSWVSTKEDNIKCVVEIPKEVKDLINGIVLAQKDNKGLEKILKEFTSKQYVTYDSAKMVEIMKKYIPEEDLGTAQVSMEKSYKAGFEFGKEFTEAMIEYFQAENAKIGNVEYYGNKLVNGQIVKVYKLRFNNENIKILLDDLVNNEKMQSLIKDYIKEMSSAVAENSEEKVSDEEINSMMNEVKMAIPQIKGMLDMFRINSDIYYGVNEAGYIVSNSGYLNISIDTAKFAPAQEGKKSPVLNFKMDFDCTADRINEDIDLKPMPDTSEINSIDYFEFIMKSVTTMMGAQ